MGEAAVHPHVRGDYEATETDQDGFLGPSPRAWGLLLVAHQVEREKRSIPTCVGTTLWTVPPPPETSVHPHVRGDYPRALA